MNYEDVKANLTRCENRNLKSIQQQKSNARIYQKAFSYTFAVLLFFNIISLTCIVSQKFKTSLITTFSSFSFEKLTDISDNFFYNLKNDKNYFKNYFEFDLPLDATFKIIDNAVVFAVNKNSNVLSCSDGVVIDSNILAKKEIQIKNDKYIFHYINIDKSELLNGQSVSKGQDVGIVYSGSKLYFYITKNDVRQNIKIQNSKVLISE